MRELRLIGVHDDGEHLLLTEDGDDRFTVPIDDALRSSLRHARPVPSVDVDSVPVPEELRPRDVQALLRAGASVSDVAERAGWTVEKVRRYEGPIRAERDHVARLARAIVVSGGAAGQADSTFGERAERRLDGRGVDPDAVIWDSWRGRDGDWTVLCSFPAGGRPRRATWHFDVRSRTLEPTDDEARWLGEDESTPGPLASARETSVYDVEAEGGLNAAYAPQVRRVRGGRTSATAVPQQPAPAAKKKTASSSADKDRTEAGERPVDLVAAMRERSKNRRRKGRAAAHQDFPEDAAPREQLDTTGDGPPVGSHPREDDPTDAEDVTGKSGDKDAGQSGDKPSVEQLGHDPVTGTADLFADLSVDETTAKAAEQEREPAEPAPDDVDESAADNVDESEEPAAETDDNDAKQPKSARPQAVPRETGTVVPDRPSSARKGRPSVPSWDDIMFGRRPGRD
ncbi:septation protein SepH [Flexivirga alba]|uniref:Septation protein SepH n=1 Tax=Flexivirga alba TaxID=702742 RepID=A0ABW2AHN8_9MICO